MSDLRCLAHEGPPAHSASPGRDDRENCVAPQVAVIAENLLLKQQLIIQRRARRRAPNLTPRVLVVMVMDQFTRRLVGVDVHCGPVDAADLCRMINGAICGRGTPRHFSTDHDLLFTDHDLLFEAHRWRANLRILEIWSSSQRRPPKKLYHSWTVSDVMARDGIAWAANNEFEADRWHEMERATGGVNDRWRSDGGS
jgi:hypothetical protein